MKTNRIINYISIIEIITLISSPAFTVSTSWADGTNTSTDAQSSPTPDPTPIGECKNTCDQYQSEKSDIILTNACPGYGPSPSSSSSPIPIENNNQVFSSQSECMEKLGARWKEVGIQCDAMDLSQKARDWNIALTTLYAASAAACWTACILTFTANPGAGAAEAACAATGIATAGVDIGSAIKLTIDGTKSQEWWENSLGSVGTALGATGAVVSSARGVAAGAAMAKDVLTSAAKGGKQGLAKAGQYGADKAGRFLGDAAESVASKVAAKGTAAELGKRIESLSEGLSCVSAGFFTVVAALKATNIALNEKQRSKECKKIEDHAGIGTGALINPSGGSNSNTTVNLGGGRFGGSTSGSGSTSGNTSGSFGTPDLANIVGSSSNFPNAQMSAAMASGPLSDIYNQLPNKANIAKDLENNGKSLQALAKDLMSQPTGSAIAGAVPDMPSELAAQLGKIDDLIKQGKISAEGLGEAYTSGGAGGSSSSSAKGFTPFSPFGSRSTASTAQTSETSFSKKAAPTLNPNGDIWHSDWNGTIFQIITLKLGQNRERIDQLEWSTPLNRALSGLPRIQEKPVYKYDLNSRGKTK